MELKIPLKGKDLRFIYEGQVPLFAPRESGKVIPGVATESSKPEGENIIVFPLWFYHVARGVTAAR